MQALWNPSVEPSTPRRKPLRSVRRQERVSPEVAEYEDAMMADSGYTTRSNMRNSQSQLIARQRRKIPGLAPLPIPVFLQRLGVPDWDIPIEYKLTAKERQYDRDQERKEKWKAQAYVGESEEQRLTRLGDYEGLSELRERRAKEEQEYERQRKEKLSRLSEREIAHWRRFQLFRPGEFEQLILEGKFKDVSLLVDQVKASEQLPDVDQVKASLAVIGTMTSPLASLVKVALTVLSPFTLSRFEREAKGKSPEALEAELSLLVELYSSPTSEGKRRPFLDDW